MFLATANASGEGAAGVVAAAATGVVGGAATGGVVCADTTVVNAKISTMEKM